MFGIVFDITLAIFALGFSIFIHELGHFIAAKKRGLVADRFSIGFGPRLFGWHWRGTDFRLSLFPLGGYVSLPQLADMGRVEGGEKVPSEALPPISYADKMIVAVMGAVFNLIFAFFLSLVLWGVGREVVKSTEVGYVTEQIVDTEGSVVEGPAYLAGLQEGDTIITIDNVKIRDWEHLENVVMTGTGRESEGDRRPEVEIGYERNGTLQTVAAFPVTFTSEGIRTLGISPQTDETSAPIVGFLEPDMPAIEAGLKTGDHLLALDGESITSGGFLSTYLANNVEKVIDVTIERNGETKVIPILPKVKEGEKQARFGFSYGFDYKTERVHYNPVQQMYIFADTMKRTLTAVVHRKSDVRVRNMSGPVGIVHGLTRMSQLGPIELLWMLALINVNLALFNLLPIPVLDGGHMMFATIAKIIGRPLPRRFLEITQGTFMLLLLGFVIYVTFFDFGRLLQDIGLIER